jgi:hypothetical protein
MAFALGGSVSLTPAPSQVTLPGAYITNFDFLSQYLPDTYEKEFERYGNRSVSSFLRMVGAEMPCNSDLIKWSEQGRLHIKYTGQELTTGVAAADGTIEIDIANSVIRVGQTIMVSDDTNSASNKAIVTAVTSSKVTAKVYESGGVAAFQTIGTNSNDDTLVSVFVYGSEFKKGSNGMVGALEAPADDKSNNPIIIKDKYSVSGSDMAQIGWVEVTTENGASGYLWYLKSEHETRLRFEDYLETAMIEAVPALKAEGAVAEGYKGSEGLFYAIEQGGNTTTGSLADLDDIDAVVTRLDKQGAIEENVLFVNRGLSFEIDNMLSSVNGAPVGYSGGPAGASFGLFDNDRDMALNLGFSGFRRGYDFYKSDWKYLNDATMRGGIVGGAVDGVLVPAGSTTVYDQILGKNAKRPFLHVRYRASETEDRKMKSWVVGSAGGASNSDLDAMEVHFLSERALCTLGANNFFLFK